MLKINLEKEMLRQNRRIALPSELLKVREFDKQAHLATDSTLARVGLTEVLLEGAEIKHRISARLNATKAFNQERVFHISQIQAICNKYYLRFLDATYYKGSIDSDLPARIQNFEIAHDVKCDTRNTKIAAPHTSFQLQEKPKDPLFFYRINEEYYYLIHKWGNDLSIFRRALSFFSSESASALTVCGVITAICFAIIFSKSPNGVSIGFLLLMGAFISLIISAVVCLMFGISGSLPFVKENEWDSHNK